MKTTKDYTKLSDADLLIIYTKKTGGIPLAVVREVRKRKLRKTYTGTFNSHMMS